MVALHDLGVINESLEQENARLRSHIRELDIFAETLAHDLKNPMATIRGFASLLQDYEGRLSNEEIDEIVHYIVDESQKLEAMIDSILLFSRVSNRHQVKIEPLDMHQIVENVNIRLIKLITQSKARITLTSTWPKAVGYSPWIEQVWMNYISNAIKYGGTPPFIEIGASQQDDEQVLFWVRDNGGGLTLEQQTTAFQPFTRLNTNNTDGHGLGLAIVARIVEKLGGKTGVESRVGEGSTFSFTLPSV